MGSVLGMVGPVSVYCDWVKLESWFAAFTSLRKHVQTPRRSLPEVHFECGWEAKESGYKHA